MVRLSAWVCPPSSRGFSLTELMVALLLGLIVTWGAVAAYSNARAAYAVADASARLQENARYALSLLESDVRMANFWGLHGQAALVTVSAAAVLPVTCGPTWVTDVSNYVTGQNNSYGLSCAASGGGARPGSDVLIVRRASSTRMTPQSGTIPTSDRSRILIVSNRLAAQIFVPQNIGNGIPAGYATTDPANAPPLADTREMLVHAYYVSRDSTVANGYPALRRKRLTTGPAITDEELLPGVEDLQIQLGIDLNGDDNADRSSIPVRCPLAADRCRCGCGCGCGPPKVKTGMSMRARMRLRTRSGLHPAITTGG